MNNMKWIILVLSIFFSLDTIFAAQKETDEIHVQEVYKTIDTLELTIDIFYSKETITDLNNTAIVFFHGGGWAFGTPDKLFSACERYAKMGIICFCVDYRLSNDKGTAPHNNITPIESLMDVKSAIRWVRKNSDRFNINPEKIVASGQSAGGHLAISTSIIEKYNESSDDFSISCVPNAIMSFSGTVNTVEAWCDHLLGKKRTEIWNISPFHNLKGDLPPMIQFHGMQDATVPFWTIEFFKRETEALGNYFELHKYPGRKHYLGKGNPKYSEYFDDEILEIADEFLRNQGLIE